MSNWPIKQEAQSHVHNSISCFVHMLQSALYSLNVHLSVCVPRLKMINQKIKISNIILIIWFILWSGRRWWLAEAASLYKTRQNPKAQTPSFENGALKIFWKANFPRSLKCEKIWSPVKISASPSNSNLLTSSFLQTSYFGPYYMIM